MTQRGKAFIKYLLGSWIAITGVTLLLDHSAQIWGGSLLLAIPAVYVFVAQRYPAEFSEAQLEKLREDDDVIQVGYDLQQSQDVPQNGSLQDLTENLARIKMRLKQYKQDDPASDELVDEVYEELADLGFYVTHDQIREWTQDLRNSS